ncbi:MAG: FxsA family protein [Alkalispirochaetaceae bacterium]
MFGRILLLFTVIPLVELYLLIQIGQLIGALPTIMIVLFTGVAGASLARQQGGTVWLEIQQEMQLGRFPADRLIDGLLLLVAGAFLITPGILTDLFGFAILIPFSRAPIRRWVRERLRRMMDRGDVHFTGFIR